MKDFGIYPKNNHIYTGSEEKFGIIIDDENYIVKFQKNSETGLINNHISEHIGSNIFNLIGESAQITMLGTYQGRSVVVCKDFNEDGETFVPFNGVGESSLERDKELYHYTYEDITHMLQENAKITNISEVIEKFWNMYIIDALIGNFDRHGANWGFIKKDQSYRFAPVFDNGSSLFPRRNSDELLKEVLEDENKLKEITYKYPTSQIRLGRIKSSYFEVINSLRFEDCNKALERIYHKIDLDKINKFINIQEGLTELQKAFYIRVIDYRYHQVIKASYLKLRGK
ncbi:MAG: HipA domain-containing protein [Acholeplasmataceae bacterium]